MGWLLLAAIICVLWALPFLLLARLIDWFLDRGIDHFAKRRKALPHPKVPEMPSEIPCEDFIGERKRRIITLPQNAERNRAQK